MNKLRITTFCIIQLLLLSSNLSAQNISIANISTSRGYFDRLVEISGNGFNSNAANLEVWFGAATGTIVSASENLIICKIPAGATTSAITVLNKTTELSATSSTIFHEVFQGATSPDLSALDNYNFAITDELFDLIIVDLDKDGNNDIMATKWKGSVTDVVAYRNTTTGSNIDFVEQNITIGTASLRLAAGDIDGDSKQDIVITREGTSSDRIYVLRNTSTPGTISFAAAVTYQLNSSQSAKRIAIRDLDLDGKPEVVVVNSSDDEISIYLNNSTAGTINLSTTPTIINSGATTGNDLVIEDFNGDGKHDIAVTQFASSDVQVLPNNSTPGLLNFNLPTVKVTYMGSLYSIAAGDINEDGKIDLVVTDPFTNKVAIILNSSTVSQISFDTPIEKTGISDGATVALADFMGNGRLDIIVSSTSATDITLFENTSSGGGPPILTQRLVPQPNRSRGVVAGDLSGDAKPDLAFTATDAGGTNYFLMAIRNNICVAPKIISDASPAICNGQTFRFSTAPVLGANFIWKKDGTEVKNSADPFYDATVAGSYTVTAETEAGACSVESAAEILVLNTGTIPVDPVASNNGPACLGSSITLSSTTVTGATYIWTGPMGFTSTDQNPIITNITAAMAGAYSVRAELSPCQSMPSVTLIEVINPPDVTASAGSSTNICTSESVTLSVGAATGYTYQWYNGATLITGATSNTYAATTAGSYTVNLQGVSNSCDLTSNAIDVTTFAAPTPVFSFSSPQCEGSAITFTETTALETGKTPTYSWDFDGDGTEDSNQQNPSYTYNTDGDFTATLTIGYQGHSCNGMTAQPIKILLPAPTITITPDNPTIISGESVQLTASGAGSYEWSPPEGLDNTIIANPVATPTAPVTYTVVSTDANSCVGSAQVTINIEELPFIAPSMFSPNDDAYKDTWEIEGIDAFPLCELVIFSRNGKIVFKDTGHTEDWDGFDLAYNKMPEGAYYYTLSCPDGRTESGSVSIIR